MADHLSLADRIRAFALQHYVRPRLAQSASEIMIRAGDVHSNMRLISRMPAVCAALDSRQFREESGLELFERTGPPQGATATFYFRPKNHPQPAPKFVKSDVDEFLDWFKRPFPNKGICGQYWLGLRWESPGWIRSCWCST